MNYTYRISPAICFCLPFLKYGLNHNNDNHNINSTNTNIEASNNQTNACTLANTLFSKTHEVNPPTNTIESEATISHSQILVEENTEALMVEIMKDA
jgi:hypothetical protein